MLDFDFVEDFIENKYNKKLQVYFNTTRQAISLWRREKKIPPERVLELLEKEGLDIKEILKNM